MFRRRKSNEKRIKKQSKLNRDEKQQEQEEFQPKILRKPEKTSEIESSKKSAEENKKKIEPKEMTHVKTLINRNHLDTESLFEFLNLENSEFYVVGAIGMKNSGKSTILNLVSTGELHRCDSVLSNPQFSEFTKGNGIDAFITKERIFLLDSAPIQHNENSREFVISEADDIQQIQTMFRLCNEILVVYESHQLMGLARLIINAKNMMKLYECDEPEITLIENRVRGGSWKNPMIEIAKNLLQIHVSEAVNCIAVPNFDFPAHDEDQLESTKQLRDEIATRMKFKAIEEPTENEKSWWEKFTKMEIDGGFFLSKFEALREKFYQQNEKVFSGLN
jgi:hypothetical protein